MLAGTMWDPGEENSDIFGGATNRVSGKNLWAEIFGPKVAKSRHFLDFSNITVEKIMIEENFCQIN